MKGSIKKLAVLVMIVILFHIPAEAAWMGVAIEDSQSEEGKKAGIKIIAVDPDGPSARAGLRVGDLIVLVDGKMVETCLSLAKIIQEVPESTSLQIIILRKGKLIITELVPALAPQHFIFIQEGWEQAQKGNYDEAIRYFTKAIDLNPLDGESYYSRGTAYSHKGQYDQAISNYTKALEINPRDAKVYINRGRAYYLKGEYDRSWEDFRKALDLDEKVPSKFLDELRKVSRRVNIED